MKRFKVIVVVAVLLVLSGCGAHVGTLKYSQPSGVEVSKVPLSNQVYVENFKDSREGYPENANRIGKLSGGFGETLKSVELPTSVSITTSDVVSDFLKGAGVDAVRTKPQQTDGYTLSGNITEFYCLWFWTHITNIKIDLSLTDNNTGKVVWNGSIEKRDKSMLFEKYPAIMKDPEVNCLGYDCHAKGINAGMNIVFSEGIAEVWKGGGLKAAIEGKL